MSSWYEYYEHSMNSLGLPTPSSLYAEAAVALATVKAIQGAISIGGDVTIGELIGAGLLDEGLIVAGGALASFYAGANVGAAIYASLQEGWDLWDYFSAPIDLTLISQEAMQHAQNAGK
jgi:hypothetical protein